jgi:LPXTG-site transpeptidase (sortase) family protein
MSTKEIILNFGLPFLLIFLVSLFLLNWGEIGWVLNFRALRRSGEEIIEQWPVFSEEEPSYEYVEGGNKVEIPKLELEAPIVSPIDNNLEDLEEALDQGVVHYPGSASPGEEGTIILMGHSAPSNWPDINYDRVFSEIVNLEEGDEIFISFNNLLYPYQVVDQHIFSREEEEIFLAQENNEKRLVLSTCYPPGKDFQRLVVVALLRK